MSQFTVETAEIFMNFKKSSIIPYLSTCAKCNGTDIQTSVNNDFTKAFYLCFKCSAVIRCELSNNSGKQNISVYLYATPKHAQGYVEIPLQ